MKRANLFLFLFCLFLAIPCQAKTIYVDAYGLVWQGPVWSFGIQSDKAWDPNPPDGQEFVSITPILSWKAGIDTQWHVIYFGTSFDDVNDSIVQPLVPPPLSYRGYHPVGDEDWDPITDGGLTFDFTTTYYWRIDEGHQELPPPIGGGTVIKGDVWSFTTEAQPIFVDIDAAGANDGTSWEDAYNYLQDALNDADSAVKPVEILVAQGIYKPDQSSADPNGTGDRTATFQLINGVNLKGGYAGFGAPDPNARDFSLYETILSGDLDGNDIDVNVPFDLWDEPTRAENTYNIVTGSGTDVTAVLDGFTITAGSATGESYQRGNGGGMRNHDGRPTVKNCIFSGNFAQWFGGGMFNNSSEPELTNCAFIRNSAIYGGGMRNIISSPILINCIFNANWAGYGGGVYNADSSPVLTNCVFNNNRAAIGGGMEDSSESTPTLTNCIFSGNSANSGGGINNRSDSGANLTNCILWGNTPDQIYGGTPTVTYSDVQGGWLGLGNIDADPCFADANHGDYHLKSQAGRWDPNSQSWVTDSNTSPCIDAGNPGCPEANEPVPNGNRRNMGAYGGTAEASKSPANWRNIADLTNDWVVDSNDLKVFVSYWLEAGRCIPSDLNRNQFVDFADYGIFALQWSYPSASEPGMTYQIDDCNMEEGQSWPIAAESNEPRFSLWVEGRYIHFKDMMYANCCPDELGLDKEINGNKITLYEIGYGGLCDCMCYFPIKATLGPFEDGTYTVEVFDNYGKLLGVVEVTIGETTGPGIIYEIEDCNQDASDVFAAEPPDLTRFKVTVEGSYIHFEDMMYANCCPDELELEMTVEDNLITIYEIEYTSEGCRCMCSFPITATLGPFEDGTYTVEVYDNYGNSLGVVEVTIGGPSGPTIIYEIEDCNREASGVFIAAPPDLTRFTVTVEGLYIHFEDMMVANCCPDELGLEMTVEDSTITIYETEYTPGGCFCICDYPVTATLGPFEPGTYVLEVYEDWGGFIGSTTVVIDPPE